MALDLVIRVARFAGVAPDAPTVDIAVSGGLIAAIEAGGSSGNAPVVDAGGRLVSPGLIETHIHLDKSRIVERCAPASHRTTRDHMQCVATVKPRFTVQDVYARARATLEGCILNGATHMRTHVEVDPNVGLCSVEALEQLAHDYRRAIDFELCVFAQKGLTGGAPAYDTDPAAHIRRVFDLARDYDVDVDLHLDVGPSAEHLDVLLVCELTERMGWGGRVAVGHGTKYSLLPPEELACLGRRPAEAGVAVTVLPATDLFVTSRHCSGTRPARPKRSRSRSPASSAAGAPSRASRRRCTGRDGRRAGRRLNGCAEGACAVHNPDDDFNNEARARGGRDHHARVQRLAQAVGVHVEAASARQHTAPGGPPKRPRLECPRVRHMTACCDSSD